jgi:hypothetical protein
MSTTGLTQNSLTTIGLQPRDECIKYVLVIRSAIFMSTRVVRIEIFVDIEDEFAGISIGIGNLQKEEVQLQLEELRHCPSSNRESK